MLPPLVKMVHKNKHRRCHRRRDHQDHGTCAQGNVDPVIFTVSNVTAFRCARPQRVTALAVRDSAEDHQRISCQEISAIEEILIANAIATAIACVLYSTYSQRSTRSRLSF